MVIWLAAIGLALHPAADAAGSPPVVGRPMDFSGAVGGPFVVQWLAAPTAVAAEEPLTLTLRIAGPGNLAEMPRPALEKLDAFKPLAVENLDDHFTPGDLPRREFRYRIRPRSADVKEIPRLKFVYFNPQIVPPARGYQTTYADSVPLTVKPRRVAPGTVAELPAWMLEPPASDELFGPPPMAWQEWLDWLRDQIGMQSEASSSGGWVLAAIALLGPPVLCLLGLAAWRRAYPDAARLAAGRRSRAATIALRTLGRATADRPELVANALIGYLHDRAGLPVTATTPAEISAELNALCCPSLSIAATIALLHRCDAARFAPGSATDAELSADTAKTVLEWETATWPGPAC